MPYRLPFPYPHIEIDDPVIIARLLAEIDRDRVIAEVVDGIRTGQWPTYIFSHCPKRWCVWQMPVPPVGAWNQAIATQKAIEIATAGGNRFGGVWVPPEQGIHAGHPHREEIKRLMATGVDELKKIRPKY